MTKKSNDRVMVSYYTKTKYSKPYIIAKDLTDQNNDPTAFTRNIRGLDKAWNEITEAFKTNVDMGDILYIFDKYKLNYHSYCAVD